MISLPSLLPSLYDWGFWVPFFFRLFIAFQLYREARKIMGSSPDKPFPYATTAPTPGARKFLAWLLMILSFMFFVGVGVQIIAVVAACAYLLQYLQMKKMGITNDGFLQFLILSALVSFSLLFLGPGPYAVDLPL